MRGPNPERVALAWLSLPAFWSAPGWSGWDGINPEDAGWLEAIIDPDRSEVAL